MKRFSIALPLLLAAASAAPAQTRFWHNDSPTSSTPREIVYSPRLDRFFFTAVQPSAGGRELFVSDGGPPRLIDVDGSPTTSSNPSQLTLVDGVLFFTAEKSGAGNELWKYDETGLTLIDVDGSPITSSNPTRLTPATTTLTVSPRLFFTARMGGRDRLWILEGTSLRPILDRSVRNLVAVSGLLYFTYDDGGPRGNELYRTNGSSVFEIQDVAPGPRSASFGEMLAVGANLYFVANDGRSGAELWRTNASTFTVSQVRDLWPGSPGSQPRSLTSLGNQLYFSADTGPAPGTGRELWKLDWRAAGSPTLVLDIAPGDSNPRELTPAPFRRVLGGDAGSRLYFTAIQGTTRELWRAPGHDGSPAERVAGVADPTGLTHFGSAEHVLFSVGGRELWGSDGTEGGTSMLWRGPVGSDPRGYRQAQCDAYFAAADASGDRELYQLRYDRVQPAMIAPFGRGTAGPVRGRTWMTMSRVPRPGAASYTFLLSNAPPGAKAYLLVATDSAAIPLGPECSLYVGGSIRLLGPVPTSARGAGSLTVRLPGPPGARAVAQFLITTPSASPCVLQWSFSDAIRIGIGG